MNTHIIDPSTLTEEQNNPIKGDKEFLIWLAEIMKVRPKDNCYLDSERGLEIGRLCIAHERNNFNWRRSDIDTFWIDVQLFTKYKLSDNEIQFAMGLQPGIENYKQHSKERNAYAEYMRGLTKLRKALASDMFGEDFFEKGE